MIKVSKALGFQLEVDKIKNFTFHALGISHVPRW